MIMSPLLFTGNYLAKEWFWACQTVVWTESIWDFNIRTDYFIWTRCPDIVRIDEKNQETFIIDGVIPGDFRVRDKEAKKISKYQDLPLKKSWTSNTKTRGISIVIDALVAESSLTK